MQAYRTLEKIFAKLNDLEQTEAILHWDMETYMPAGGVEARAEQLATLKSISHAMLSDPEIEDLLAHARGEEKKLSKWEKANLELMERAWIHTTAVPKELVTSFARAGTKCQVAWREAREKNDFKSFSGQLEEVVKHVREIAAHKGEALDVKPYDALLDQYDRGRKSEDLEKIFSKLEAFLPDFIQKVTEKQKGIKITPIKDSISAADQKAFALKLLETIGFDFQHGRLDESVHPFCGGYFSDVRITTRFDENCVFSGIMGIIHEAGHAMYEAGLPKKWSRQPVGHAKHSMSLHESQSLLFEMQASRSEAFLAYLVKNLQKEFGKKSKAWSYDNIKNICHKVEPSFIRVDADEVTYPLHVILRYRIEQYLLAGEMEVEDLPEAWAQGMKKYLGITPPDHTQGCMQDIHWTDGTFGYFPSYTIGAIYAAQLFAAIEKDEKELSASLEKGDMAPIRSWLNQNIHGEGSLHMPDQLIKKATGKSLDVDSFTAHLTNRYLA